MKNSIKSQGKQKKRGPESASIPVDTTPSNAKGDQLSMALLIGLLVLATAILGFGLFWSIQEFHAGFNQHPLDWGKCAVAFVALVLSILAARSIASISFFGSVALASRMGAWKTVEAIGLKSGQLRKLIPGGTTWLTTAYLQTLVSRGRYKEAIAASQSEWERSSEDPKQIQYLGTVCYTAGIATQADGDLKQSQLWNERAVEILNKCIEQLGKPPKGMLAKLTAPQSEQATGQLRTQLSAAYFNLATHYFNGQDYRRAKENYKLALDNAKKAPDFPQKNEMIKFGTDQMARLKHS